MCWKSHFLFTQENCSSVPFLRHLLEQGGTGGREGAGRPWWGGGHAGDTTGVLQGVRGGADEDAKEPPGKLAPLWNPGVLKFEPAFIF